MSVINTNIKALSAQDSSRIAEKNLSTAMQRLSTGLRINSAKDDAAGLAIATRMTAQVRGMSMAIRNANDGISMTQTAEGAIGQVADMLQRMRELSVQASSGTLTGTDRAALQTEVAQLKKEIDSIATKTTFNTIKLLDGTAKNVVLQTGTNAGDQMAIGFDSVKTKDIGVAGQLAVSSIGGAVGTYGAFDEGALLLNGVAVGASLATDDVASSASASASAIAKAAAINRVAEQSGVYARAATNVVAGTLMTAAAGAGTVTINGIATSSIATTTDSSVSRQRVVAAINAISNQTGVTAIDTQDDALGVRLEAKDGRNIALTISQTTATFTAASTGLAAGAPTTYVGSYELFTKDGASFTVGQAAHKSISTSGLQLGTYQSAVAETVTYTRGNTAAATAPSSADVGVLNGNTLIINDVQITAGVAGDDTSSFDGGGSSKAASAIAIAAAINKKSAVTGVTAKAEANVLQPTDSGAFFTADATANGTLFLNGQTISVSAVSRASIMTSINGKASLTGVRAVEYGDGIGLIADDGRNIAIASDITAAKLGLGTKSIGNGTTAADALTYYGSVSLQSEKAFSIRSGSEGKTNFEKLGFKTGTFGGEAAGAKVADLDISTANGAAQAISVLDSALETVNLNRANAGAYNNRLDATVNNLTVMNDNITASRSRIQDTDYATETTSLARNQIIQQAATAMLAQANQSAQTVLALLK